MKKALFFTSGIIPKFICFLLLSSFSTLNLDAQTKILNRHCPDYPAGTICSGCDADDTCSTFILPPAKFNQPYSITIPLFITDLDECEINNITSSTSNYTLTLENCNEVNLLFNEWDALNEESYISFNLYLHKTGYYEIENQVYKIPIIRDTTKIVLVLDISESMASNINGTTNTRIDELKDAVNYLSSQLEQFRQEGDSIGLTYYNTEVIQPEAINFSNDFIEITDWSGPVEDFSSTKINNDLSPRTPEGMTVLGEGLLDAKNKLLKDNSINYKRIVFLFSDGLQDAGNQLNLNGISYNSSLDSLNNSVVNSNDSIIYITISTSQAADVPPLMAAIAYKNNGISLHVDGNSSEYETFLNNQLNNILHGDRPKEVATRIIGLNPRNDSLKIDADQNLSIYFNEKININTGSILILRSLDDSEFEEINVTSGLVLGNGTSIITVNPTQDLESETEYYILIDENAFVGVLGNSFAGITSSNYWTFTSEDILSPSVTISTLENNPTNSSPFEIAIEFSEEINGFDISEIMVTNGSADNLNTTDSIVFTSDITPTADGLITINIESGVVVDNAGNPNTESNIFEINFDSTLPSVSISTIENNPANSNPFEITIEFSEEISGFDLADISVVNGSASNLNTSNDTIFTADIIPTADGLITINIESGVAVDNAGNQNTVSNAFEINFDSTAPSVSLSTAETSPTNSSSFEITIEFPEEITGLELGDVTVINATASNLYTSNDTIFTADITPTADGLVSINIESNAAIDNAGNPNTVSNTLEINFDSTRPSVSLSADNDSTTNAQFNTYVNFSERIIGFNASEINIINGNINSLSTSDSIDYVAIITAITQGEIDININENQVSDSAGNMNTAADELTVTYYVPTNIEVLKKDGISIYSNNGFIIVEFLKPHTLNFQSGYIEIYSLNGSLIKKENIERNFLFKTYVSNQRKIYFVKLTLDKTIYYAKIQN